MVPKSVGEEVEAVCYAQVQGVGSFVGSVVDLLQAEDCCYCAVEGGDHALEGVGFFEGVGGDGVRD